MKKIILILVLIALGAAAVSGLTTLFKGDDSIKITTIEEFMNMNKGYGEKYVLQNDLDFSGTIYTQPFYNELTPFVGKFIGNGYTIKNLTMHCNYASLFGVLSGGVEDLQLENIQ